MHDCVESSHDSSDGIGACAGCQNLHYTHQPRFALHLPDLHPTANGLVDDRKSTFQIRKQRHQFAKEQKEPASYGTEVCGNVVTFTQ